MKKIDIVCREIRAIFAKKDWRWRDERTPPSVKKIRETILALARDAANGKPWSCGRLRVSQVRLNEYEVKVKGTKYTEIAQVKITKEPPVERCVRCGVEISETSSDGGD